MKKIKCNDDPHGFKGAAKESGLSRLSRLGRKLALISEDIYEALDELEALQDEGISNVIDNFSEEQLNRLYRTAELLKRQGKQLSN